jgi:hypothetical protein
LSLLTTLLARLLLSATAMLTAALSWLLVLLARLLSTAALLAAVLTTLVLLARFLFVRVHDRSVVAPLLPNRQLKSPQLSSL